MALNMCEIRIDGIKIAFLSKKLRKVAQQLGVPPLNPRLWYVWVTLTFSKRLQNYVYALFNIISFSLNSRFAKSWLCANRQIFNDVIACDLWFRPPPIKNSGYAYELEVAWKTFLKIFFSENTCGCVPWSLALASSIPVLGLERVCPWPRPCPRIFFVSLALAMASSHVSSTPPLLNSHILVSMFVIQVTNHGSLLIHYQLDVSLFYAEKNIVLNRFEQKCSNEKLEKVSSLSTQYLQNSSKSFTRRKASNVKATTQEKQSKTNKLHHQQKHG